MSEASAPAEPAGPSPEQPAPAGADAAQARPLRETRVWDSSSPAYKRQTFFGHRVSPKDMKVGALAETHALYLEDALDMIKAKQAEEAKQAKKVTTEKEPPKLERRYSFCLDTLMPPKRPKFTILHDLRGYFDPQYRLHMVRKEMKKTARQLDLGIGQMFDLVDSDGSGVLDRDELKLMIEKVGILVKEVEIDTLMEILDADGSGGVELDEFEKWYYSSDDFWLEKRRRDPDDIFNDSSLLARESLRFDPTIRKALKKLWILVDSDKSGLIDVEEYVALNLNLQRAVMDDYDDTKGRQIALREWEFDCQGEEALDERLFMLSFFQLADAWRDGPIVPEAYCFFLDFLMDRTAMVDPDTGETIWKWEKDPLWYEKLKPMAEVERERAAARSGSGGGSLHLKTHQSEIGGKVHLQKEKKDKKGDKKRKSTMKSVAKKVGKAATLMKGLESGKKGKKGAAAGAAGASDADGKQKKGGKGGAGSEFAADEDVDGEGVDGATRKSGSKGSDGFDADDDERRGEDGRLETDEDGVGIDGMRGKSGSFHGDDPSGLSQVGAVALFFRLSPSCRAQREGARVRSDRGPHFQDGRPLRGADGELLEYGEDGEAFDPRFDDSPEARASRASRARCAVLASRGGIKGTSGLTPLAPRARAGVVRAATSTIRSKPASMGEGRARRRATLRTAKSSMMAAMGMVNGARTANRGEAVNAARGAAAAASAATARPRVVAVAATALARVRRSTRSTNTGIVCAGGSTALPAAAAKRMAKRASQQTAKAAWTARWAWAMTGKAVRR